MGNNLTASFNCRCISSLATLTSFLFFQSCAEYGVSLKEGSLSDSSFSEPIDPINLNENILTNTNLNTPVTVELKNSVNSLKLFDANTLSLKLVSQFENGNFEIVDLVNHQIKYSPKLGFRGSDKAIIKISDKHLNQITFTVEIKVENAVRAFEPALAVRGMGCIQCHAQVASNIITDFGYKNDYYFSNNLGGNWWNRGGLYGDHGTSFNSMSLAKTVSTLVPKADLPVNIAAALNQKTFADYISSEYSKSSDEGTKASKVVEKTSVYIGAPTDENIKAAFSFNGDTRFKYFKNSPDSIELSGLLDKSTFFMNSDVLNCEGDLAIKGPLYLENLIVNSSSGCRIYVIGSVFIFGKILQTSSSDLRNLQITSSRSISMGLGLTKKDDKFCDPNSRFAANQSDYNVSSLVNRYSTFWTVPSQMVRQNADPKAFGDSVVAESKLIEKELGLFYDAECRFEGRNISFDRLLLNAPAIHSRYAGNVTGTIIAEYSVMSLGMFKFQYDPVFSQVPILPFLDPKIYLDIIE